MNKIKSGVELVKTQDLLKMPFVARSNCGSISVETDTLKLKDSGAGQFRISFKNQVFLLSYNHSFSLFPIVTVDGLVIQL